MLLFLLFKVPQTLGSWNLPLKAWNILAGIPSLRYLYIAKKHKWYFTGRSPILWGCVSQNFERSASCMRGYTNVQTMYMCIRTEQGIHTCIHLSWRIYTKRSACTQQSLQEEHPTILSWEICYAVVIAATWERYSIIHLYTDNLADRIYNNSSRPHWQVRRPISIIMRNFDLSSFAWKSRSDYSGSPARKKSDNHSHPKYFSSCMWANITLWKLTDCVSKREFRKTTSPQRQSGRNLE